MSTAFYKGKMQNLVTIAHQLVLSTMQDLDNLLGAQDSCEVNMIAEMQNLNTRVILCCTMGEDTSAMKVEQWQDGKLS